MDRIERELEDSCIYKRVKLDYTYGLGKIYTNEEIEKAKHSPSFKREYQLFYLGLEGNIFPVSQIEASCRTWRIIQRLANQSLLYS